MSARAPEAGAAEWAAAEATLVRGLERLALAPALAVPLLDYLRLLSRWNRAYNLTAVTAPGEMVVRHLLDSLAVLPHLRGPRVLDVGTGAGLPGIPLALARPEWTFELLDSNGKKTRFVAQAATELGLGNVRVVWSRVETYRSAACFNTVVSRAYAALGDWLRQTRALACPDGVWLAMKGTLPEAELGGLPPGFTVAAVERLQVPGLAAERHLVVLNYGPATGGETG